MNRQQLFEDNLKIVYKVIHLYYPNYIRDEDIVQTANLGLWKAANTYDENKGCFSTYAYRCIRNAINMEFRERNKSPHTLSLDYEINSSHGDTVQLYDIIVGDSDVDYVDLDSVYRQLTEKELKIFNMIQSGMTTKQIIEKTGFSQPVISRATRKVKKLLNKQMRGLD